MDPRFPLSRLTLEARSVVDELSFVALHDVAEVARRLGVEHRLIGAHMVTLHAYRWGLGAELYRETRDVDLGVPLEVARDPALIGALEETGYRRSAGNRLVRSIADVPVEVEAPGAEATREAAVDVLIPAYTSRARDNVRGRGAPDDDRGGGTRRGPQEGAGAGASPARAAQRPDS